MKRYQRDTGSNQSDFQGVIMAEAILASGIYAITNSVNGKAYIGSAVNIKKRWGDHRRMMLDSKHHSIKFQRAWGKYGEKAFVFSVLLYCDRKDLICYEQCAIDAYDAFKSGYNMSPTAGNSLGVKASEETRAKLSAAKRGGKLSEEHKKKIGLAHKGRKRNHSWLLSEEQKAMCRARRHTDEAKAKISAAGIGNKYAAGLIHSAETKAKMSASQKGVPKSPEHAAKVAAAQKGRKFTEEHKQKLSLASQNKPVNPAAIAAMAQANRGRKMSPESIAKRQASRYPERYAKPPE